MYYLTKSGNGWGQTRTSVKEPTDKLLKTKNFHEARLRTLSSNVAILVSSVFSAILANGGSTCSSLISMSSDDSLNTSGVPY